MRATKVKKVLGQQELMNTIEEIAKNSVQVERKFRCALCQDTFNVYKWRTVNDEVLVGPDAYHEFLVANRGIDERNLILEHWSESCEPCRIRDIEKAGLDHAKTRNGEQVTFAFVEEQFRKSAGRVQWKEDPLKLARALPDRSTYLVGGTGTMKTVIAEYWFNSYLRERKGQTKRIMWMSERRIFAQLRVDADAFLNTLAEMEIVFFDEVFYPNEWRMQDEKGFLNGIQFSAWRDVWEYLSANRQVIVIATSNRRPEEVISDESTPLLRRMYEVYDEWRQVYEL